MPNGVLLLTGPPGSGKTTTARLITVAAGLGAHVEADSFFRFVRSGYLEPWLPESHTQNVTVMQAVASAAAAYADGGSTTVVDGIVSPKWFLSPPGRRDQAAQDSSGQQDSRIAASMSAPIKSHAQNQR